MAFIVSIMDSKGTCTINLKVIKYKENERGKLYCIAWAKK